MKRFLVFAAIAAVFGCSQNEQAGDGTAQPATQESTADATTVPMSTDAPSGTYKLDPAHSSLIFRVSHLGFSNYTARFDRFDTILQLDTQDPSASSVIATIDPTSLNLPAPPQGFREQLLGPEWLNTAEFPQMRFASTEVVLTSANTARVTGDFTLHGETHPVSLDVIFNGGYPGMSMDPQARIGLSAHGTFKRSEFGMGYGVPAPGSNMGVGDEVEIIIDAEFTGPPLIEPLPPPAP